MSENTETTTVDKSQFAEYDKLLSTLKAVTDDANADAKRRKSLLADAQGKVDEILNESDDEKMIAYRDRRDVLIAKRDEINAALDEMNAQAKEYAKGIVPEVSEETLKSLQDSFLAKRQKVTALRKAVLVFMDEEEFNAACEAYGIVNVISSASGKTTSDATGIVRKRLSEATLNGEPVQDSKGKVSFTTLSNKTGIDGDLIRESMAKAAEVESVKDIPSDTTVDFSIEHDNKTFTFSITTK